MIEPKVRSKNEVVELIATEFKKTREDCKRRGAPLGAREVAEAIYAMLSDNYLIELEP